MWPLAIATGVGALAASAMSYYNQRRSERLQTELANTAVQRRAADLRAAGFNPILAAQGQGAGVPSVAPVRFDNPLEQAADVYVSAKRIENEGKLLPEQLEKLRAEIEVLRKQPELMEAQRSSTLTTARATEQKINMGDPLEQSLRFLGNTLEKLFGTRSGDKDASGLIEQAKLALKLFGTPEVRMKMGMPKAVWDALSDEARYEEWSRQNSSPLHQAWRWIVDKVKSIGASSAEKAREP